MPAVASRSANISASAEEHRDAETVQRVVDGVRKDARPEASRFLERKSPHEAAPGEREEGLHAGAVRERKHRGTREDGRRDADAAAERRVKQAAEQHLLDERTEQTFC